MSNPGEVGRLSAALTIDGAQEFQRELQRVGASFQEAGAKGNSLTSVVDSGMRTAAGATTGLVTAAAAYVAILAKTGVAYNSVQQNSRAALSVMLGGAEAANKQMSLLDDFARNSPFSKSTFIQAQQQLLGFGVEAEKVLPTLDAIQQTVAAFGGNAEQITSITDVLARLQSQGRLSGDALERLGYYGVDAAKIIGDQMGLTAAEIKDMASKPGGIPVEQIWDPLVNGLQENFGGAADGIKEQWSGAVDRIKAANRDLGATIAEPFVSAQGGGMAVTWANQVADVLRAIGKQAVPVMEILTNRGGGLFAGITEGLDSAQQSIARWDAGNLESSLDKLETHAPGIAALGGAVLALGAQVGPLGKMLSTLGMTANPVLAAFVGLAATSPELRGALVDLVQAGAPLVPVLAEVAQIASGTLNTALPIVADGIGLVVAVAKPLVELVSALPAPLLLGVAGFLALHKAVTPLEGGIKTVADTLRGFAEQSQVQAALGETSFEMGAIATGSMRARGAVEGLGTAMKTAFLSNPIGIALTVVSAAVGVWAAANASAQAKVAEHTAKVKDFGGTLNSTTGSITAATAAQVEKNLADTRAKVLAEEMGVAYKDVQDAILGDEAALARLNGVMGEHIATTTLGDENLDTWSATATNAKNRVSELTEIVGTNASAIEDAKNEVRDKIQADREAAAAMTDVERSNKRYADALAVARDITQDATTRVNALKQALDELNGGEMSAEETAKRLSQANLTLAEGLASTDEAGNKLWASTLEGAGTISLATREGIAFSDTMRGAQDAMLQATMQAADQALANNDLSGAVAAATAAGDGYIATMQQTMRDAGLTEEQIATLTDTYLAVPSTIATMLIAEGFDATDAQVIDLLTQLDKLEAGATLTLDDPMTPEVQARMEALGFTVNNLPDGTVNVVATGVPLVESQLAALAAPRTATIFAQYALLNAPPEGIALPQFSGGGLTGNMYSSGKREAFATGGFPSGIYNAPPGQPALYKFAEEHLPWEVFISPAPGYEAKNAALAHEALRRLGMPAIPVSALGNSPGMRAFATGGMPGSAPQMPTAQRFTVDAGRTSPLVGTVVLGQGVTRNEFAELDAALDYYERRGR